MNNKFFDRDDSVLLVLGGLDTSGGMFNYLKAWIHLIQKECQSVAVCATAEVLENLKFSGFTIALPYSSNDNLKDIYKRLQFKKYNKEFYEIRKQIDSFLPSYVHIVDETIFFPQLKSVLSGYEKIITIHDPIYHPGQFRSLMTRILCLYSRLSYFCTKKLKIHLHSKRSIFPSILSLYGKNVIYPHPLPETKFSINHHNTTPVVAFMGRIEKYKGIDLFIQSIQEYEKKYQDAIEILIVGKGEVTGFESLRFDNRLTIVNEFVSDIQFHKYMSEIDILILPYISATQSGVGYLAKAYGRKIVCTDVGNLADLIESESDGYIVEKNPRIIANAIHKIASRL
ncbi:glycosyltransferase [Shewanella sp.]|uniref:glycosyltransferase n=1 Tax=Shewanella sp. TaxID=50422 RepID=UPI003567E4C6